MLKRKLTFAGAILAACTVLAGGASAASAAPATFNVTGPGGGLTAQGPWTVTNIFPGQTVTCSTGVGQANFNNTGSPLQGSMPFVFGPQFCSHGAVELYPSQPFLASSNAGAYSLSSAQILVRLAGSTVSNTAVPVAIQVPWTNGAGSVKSTITFSNTTIAVAYNGQPIKLTGTFSVAQGANLVLLS